MKIGIVITIMVMSLLMCHHDKKPTQQWQWITVASQPLTSTLYYAGTIQPLKSIAVISPADGVLADKLFSYGDVVKPGQLLFTVSSEKFQTDYKAALIQYVKARSELNNNRGQLLEGNFLHKNLLISDDDFKIKQTNFYNAQLAFLQAKELLGVMVKQLDIKEVNLYDLTIADVDKITHALHMEGNLQKLQIASPVAGVVLLPMKGDGVSDAGKKLGKGEQVKSGDVLALIGDVNGFSVRVSVNEFDINQIQLGQSVKVTGSAFPDDTLKGSIASVDHQAQLDQNGVPAFSAEVIVSALTPEQQKVIHMGMSAKVEVNVETAKKITVPIAAITEKNGVAFVKCKHIKTGVIEDVPVKTGTTTADAVVVISGLVEGDSIAVPD